MNTNIISLFDSLLQTQENLIVWLHSFSDNIERQTDEIDLLAEIRNIIEMLGEVTSQMNDVLNRYNDVLYYELEPEELVAPQIEISDLILNQKNIRKMLQNTLLFPLDINNSSFVKRLCNLVFYDAGHGLTARVEHRARFFLIVISGFMLIRKFGGMFSKHNGICIKLQNPGCVILLESQCKILTRYSEWLLELDIHLTEYRDNSVLIPKEFKGIKML